MLSNVFLIGLLLLFVWLGVVTFFFWRSIAHYNNLTKGISSKTLKSILDHLLADLQSSQKDIEKLITRCDTIEKQELLHIQKIGLLRFNPFKDTGGDQSFIIALIDAHDTGVVISGLYSRSGTRWYAKKVVHGKGLEHELSEEEKKAIKEAHTTKNNG